MPTLNSPLESMVAKAEALYSLPAIAMEVVRLTDSERIDTRALKECIERDPALAAKLLKVVNSSLFGLSGKVENLTQAIALLGIKPLKLLVLGFSLPDALLADLDTEQLGNYWRGALTRAVAARQLAESQWKMPGDDAFLVALLQDIGLLVLLQQLGTPYARFLTQVRSQCGRLVDLEQSSLGFDHRQLTVALMRKWQLPEMYSQPMLASPARENTTHVSDARATAQVLHLANLLAELVDEHRLSVLPELLDLGQAYCGMTKDDLSRLVAEAEPQVEQLASVLQLELPNGETYDSVLAAAHRKLAKVAEDAAGMIMLTDDKLCDLVLEETRDLEQAIRDFTHVSSNATPLTAREARADAAQAAAAGPRGRATSRQHTQATMWPRLSTALAASAATCRQQREPLSLLIAEASSDEHRELEIDCATLLQSAVQQVMIDNDLTGEQVLRVSPRSLAIVLPSVERRDAVQLAKELDIELAAAGKNSLVAIPVHVKAGVATISAIPKGFESDRLLESANACLDAARSSGGSATKSIEVY